jgi:hypothetical protein
MMKFAAGFLGLFILAQSVYAQTGYLCVADMAVGFSYDKTRNAWKHTNFNTRGQKFLLAKSSTGGWEWKRFGEKFSLDTCEKEFNSAGYMHCDGFNTIVMSKENLRFQMYYAVGYVSAKPGSEGGDTPSITIGTCAPLE